jgi:carbon-monoxide dehydrogenase large subunit
MTKFGVAQPVRRVEDPRLLLGLGRYTDDIAPEAGLHGFVLRSPYAAAKIISIDVTEAVSLPGVAAIYTGADLAADNIGNIPCMVPLKNRDGTPRAESPRPALAQGFVRHVGDPVAFIVADSLQTARDAAEAVLVDYEALPAVTDMEAALAPGAPAVWPAGNQVFDWEIGDKAKVDGLFAQAAHVTRLRIVNNRVVVNSMEARAAFAAYDGERWTLTTNTQGGWGIKSMLAQMIFHENPRHFASSRPMSAAASA